MLVKKIIDEQRIFELLEKTREPGHEQVLEILKKAQDKKGLNLEEVGHLINIKNSELVKKIFETAGKIKKEIYGERLVLFAPLYISSYCVNDCEYCGFHSRNKTKRKKLSLEEIEKQVEVLEDMGHKRLLLEFGEDPKENPIDYVVNVIKRIYNTKKDQGEIRRVNINIAATSIKNYKKLRDVGIGTYQLFQETYHRKTYEKLHRGPKADYERQLFAHDRAFEAGIDDVGLGVLFGLYDWRFEVLSLLSHASYLDKKYGVGPHTFSVPRLQPAPTVKMDSKYFVDENTLLKIIAILRLAVPYTGMIVSTRERPEIRAKAFDIGISQTSAASRTSPGGYSKKEIKCNQFEIADHRNLDDTIKSILEKNSVPSFCTACYRTGRTGEDFMKLAKPGDIQNLCRPNALLTLKEYLEDYATEEVKILGDKVIENYLQKIPNEVTKEKTKDCLKLIENGKRDLYF